MTCLERDSDLQAFLDGELDPSQARSVQHHVRQCAFCQSRLQSLQDLRAALRAAAQAPKAPPRLRDRIDGRLRQLEDRRRRSWKVAAALAALLFLGSLGGGYWLYVGREGPPLIAALARAHAGTVRDEHAIAFLASDVDAVQRWLQARLSFRPILPRAGWGGFHLRGARILSLSDGTGALMLFGRGDQRVSLVSLPDATPLPSGGKVVDADGVRFWIYSHGMYSLVLWTEHGLLHAMISDEEPDETLEYARLCAQQMRSPA